MSRGCQNPATFTFDNVNGQHVTGPQARSHRGRPWTWITKIDRELGEVAGRWCYDPSIEVGRCRVYRARHPDWVSAYGTAKPLEGCWVVRVPSEMTALKRVLDRLTERLLAAAAHGPDPSSIAAGDPAWRELRAAARLAAHGSRPLRRVASRLLGPAAATAAVWRWAAGFPERPPAGQWRDVVRAWRDGVPPEDFYRLGFVDPERRRRAHLYLFQHETALFAAWGAASDALADKRAFARRCAERGLPTPLPLGEADAAGLRLARPLSGVDIFAKPARGSRGRGARVWLLTGQVDVWRDAGQRVFGTAELWAALTLAGRREPYVVQQRVAPDDALLCVAPDSPPVLRVVSVAAPSGGEVVFALAALPRRGQLMSHDGIWAPLDLSDGRLGRAFRRWPLDAGCDVHPDTGAPITGRRLSGWPETLALVRRAHSAFAEHPVIGWDVALGHEGPVLLEGNLCWETALPQRLIGPLGDTAFAKLCAGHIESRRAATR